MIYEVYIDDELLYYPNDETFAIIDSKLETALNEAGTFECDVPSTNLRYNELTESCLRKSLIRILKDNEEIFFGEVREVTQNFDFTKHIYAVGEMAFLFDSIQPQARYQGTVEAMFRSIIASHNSQVEDRKKFTVGNVLATDPNDYVYRYTNREDTLTAIREKICKTLDGYLRIRKQGNTRYLDLVPLSQYGSYCLQEIQFGENLLDYSCNYTTDSIATALIPLGARLDDDQRTADAIEGLDEYLTIKSVNSGKDYVYNQSAVNRFGWVKVVKEWSDVTVPASLKTKAQNWLTSAQYANMELEVSAVDLNMLDRSFESFEVGDTVHVWAEPYGMDTTFPVQKKTIYLNDLSKNTIVLSNTAPSKSYTSQASNAVNELREEIPETSPILQEAKNRALAMMLDDTTSGHVIFEWVYDQNNIPLYIDAISLCNAPTIEASTTRWRWSNGAFGYMKRDNINQNWSEAVTAMTASGEIVATMITTGLMLADRIRGGQLIIGGRGYSSKQSGKYTNSIEIRNSNDKVLVWFDAEGMHLDSSQTISWGNISGKEGVANKSEIPTDVNQLNDASGQKWSTQIGENFIKTTSVVAQNLITKKIDSIEGNIGHWQITNYGLEKYKDSDKNQWITIGSRASGNDNAIEVMKKVNNSWVDMFKVDWDGNAEMTGKIHAKAGGDIAGWNIADDALRKEVTSGGQSAISKLTESILRFCAAGWKRLEASAGKLIINTANDDDCGIFVCNGGRNYDDRPKDGTWLQITANGITRGGSDVSSGTGMIETGGARYRMNTYDSEGHYVTSTIVDFEQM